MEGKALKRRGIFITLEGNEGCGKSTQIKLLFEHLQKEGRRVFSTREPGGTKLGDEIRALLLDPKHKQMSPVTETFLYMASRAQLVAEVISPRLKNGEIVICDRWLDATVAYQGYAGGLDIRWIRELGRAATRGVSPDLSLYLDLPVKAGLARAKKSHRADRIEQKPVSFHEKVRKGFLAIAKAEPKRFHRLPLSLQESPMEVHERIKLEVHRVLSKR